jgi:hypothetical protein
LATISQEWDGRIRTVVENNERAGGRRIRTLLLEAGYPDEDLPSARTIDRMIKRHIGSEDRIDYRYVFWPESFERGDLRWEAAPAFFELLRWNHHLSPPWPLTGGQVSQVDDPEWEKQMHQRYKMAESGLTAARPTVRMVRALHAVNQVAPDGPFAWRYEMASHLTVEAAHINREVEARIAAEVHAGYVEWVKAPNARGDQE